MFLKTRWLNFKEGTAERLEAVKSLKNDLQPESVRCDDDLSFAEFSLNRQRCMNEGTINDYLDTRFIDPTSNVCEHLLSRAV